MTKRPVGCSSCFRRRLQTRTFAAAVATSALTFDDLPMTRGPACDSATVREVTARLTGTLERRGVPAAGLVTPGRACLSPVPLRETLGRWRAIGAVLGNHSATHSVRVPPEPREAGWVSEEFRRVQRRAKDEG